MKLLRPAFLGVILLGGLLFILSCISPGNVCTKDAYHKTVHPDDAYKIYYNITDFKEARKGYGPARSQQYDLNGDGVFERYTLQKGCLTVKSGSHILWQTPEDWWVDLFFIGDITNDGNPKLNLSVWKEGSFGPYKPFWIEKEDTSVKNHLFIFKLEGDKFKPIWQSSNLDYPMDYATLVHPGNDGKVKLMVREGSYTDPERNEITLWEWREWGFYRVLGE